MPISFRPSGTAEYVDRTVTSFLLSDSTCAPGAPGFESVPPFGARMSFVSSYGVVRGEQLGESSDSRRDFHGTRGEDIHPQNHESISGTRARWRHGAARLVEGDARGVPFPVMSAPTADVVICGAG